MNRAELSRLGCRARARRDRRHPAEPYVETERHIRERRARGLFADMRFTMAQPEVSCHPETLLAGARTVVSAALCYYAPEPPLERGEGRLPRYTWHDGYAELRARLDAARAAARRRYRVLVDANQHVDREAAARSGVGFYGKNTMLITRRHGSWVVLGTLVTDVGARADAAARRRLRLCTLCIDACPTGALDEPGVLDATKCLSYWTQAPAPIPEPYRAALGAQVYGCDICQDVCPWNRGVEQRRADDRAGSRRRTSISSLARGGRRRARGGATTASTSRATTRAGCAATRSSRSATSAGTRLGTSLARYAAGDDELLCEHARWALERTLSK